jgi:pimeloyl-ACP methyl ester carboxylesterase
MKIVLLPGLDGTGELFAPLIEELHDSFEIQIIRYDTQKKQSYQELFNYVIDNLPSDDFILVAESFSGVIAYQIGLKKPQNLKHIILVATFLQNPRPILLNLIPNSYILSLPIPKIIIKMFFLGFSTDIKTINLFQKIIKTVSPNVLYFRLQEIKKLKLKEEEITLPITYIQANDDQLVLKKSLKKWERVCHNLEIFQVDGKHFILQSNPKKCAEIITQTMCER